MPSIILKAFLIMNYTPCQPSLLLFFTALPHLQWSQIVSVGTFAVNLPQTITQRSSSPTLILCVMDHAFKSLPNTQVDKLKNSIQTIDFGYKACNYT